MIEALEALGIQVVEGDIDFCEKLELPRLVVYPPVRTPSEYMLDGRYNHLEGVGQVVCVANTARGARYWAERIPDILPASCKIVGAGIPLKDMSNPAAVEWSVTLDVKERN